MKSKSLHLVSHQPAVDLYAPDKPSLHCLGKTPQTAPTPAKSLISVNDSIKHLNVSLVSPLPISFPPKLQKTIGCVLSTAKISSTLLETCCIHTPGKQSLSLFPLSLEEKFLSMSLTYLSPITQTLHGMTSGAGRGAETGGRGGEKDCVD